MGGKGSRENKPHDSTMSQSQLPILLSVIVVFHVFSKNIDPEVPMVHIFNYVISNIQLLFENPGV